MFWSERDSVIRCVQHGILMTLRSLSMSAFLFAYALTSIWLSGLSTSSGAKDIARPRTR